LHPIFGKAEHNETAKHAHQSVGGVAEFPILWWKSEGLTLIAKMACLLKQNEGHTKRNQQPVLHKKRNWDFVIALFGCSRSKTLK